MAKKKGLDLGLIQQRIADEDDPPSTEQSVYKEPPNYVARRMDLQNNQGRGKREKRITYRIDPSVCRIREDHDRDYSKLNEDNCRELIDGIKMHGQETPAIVRLVENADGFQYELVCGARRHWVATYLKTDFIVEVRDLNDEEVFIISDEENRNRQDISDYERAIKYRHALGNLYQSQVQMGERMGVSKDWLSRYLDLANMDQDIIDAYQDLAEVKVHHVRELKPLMKVDAQAKRILAEAREMQADPQKGATVLARLKAAAKPATKKSQASIKTYSGANNKPFVKVKRSSPKKLVLEIDPTTGTSLDDWLNAVRSIHAELGAKP